MKRCITAVLALMLAFALLAAPFGAVEVNLADEGKTLVEYGDWMLEKIDGDTRWALDSYIGDGGDVYVPRLIGELLVIRFNDHCFASNTAVTSVTTASPLWTVGDYAFIDCTSLKSFVCNFAMNSIGVGAFSGATSLSSIDLEKSGITTVKEHCFTNTALTEVALPETCTSIERYAFYNCASLAKITIPDNVTEIADTAFTGCDALVIYCTTDSYAHEYAEAHGIDYVLTDAQTEYSFIIGDTDGDGKVTIIDATKIQRLLAELVDDPDGLMTLRAANGEALNIIHATRIQQWLADYSVTGNIGEETTAMIQG